MPSYQPGVGIVHTDVLTIADIGLVPDSTRKRNPAGTYGRMNWGTIQYVGDPYNPPTHHLNEGDIDALAVLFAVGTRTVERWFGVTSQFSQVQYRNCVPLNNGYVPSGPVIGALGARVCNMNADTRLRVLLATCLTVEGGLQREPLYTKGGGPGHDEPYEQRSNWETLAAGVEYVEAVYDGNADNLLAGPPLSSAWVQITIEPGQGGTGWDVILYIYFPYPEEYENTEDCPDEN